MQNDLNKFYLECDCKCGILSLEIDKDDEFGIYCYISRLEPNFYTKQGNLWRIIKERFYLVWKMILGKEYMLYDLVLTKEQFYKYKEFINRY